MCTYSHSAHSSTLTQFDSDSDGQKQNANINNISDVFVVVVYTQCQCLWLTHIPLQNTHLFDHLALIVNRNAHVDGIFCL